MPFQEPESAGPVVADEFVPLLGAAALDDGVAETETLGALDAGEGTVGALEVGVVDDPEPLVLDEHAAVSATAPSRIPNAVRFTVIAPRGRLSAIMSFGNGGRYVAGRATSQVASVARRAPSFGRRRPPC